MEKLIEKRCYCCGNIKPITEFNKNKSKPSGHCDECKECKKVIDLNYKRSEVGLIVNIYNNQKHISKKKRAYTTYLLKNPTYHFYVYS